MKAKAIFFVLIGVAGLLLRSRYTGPWQEIVHSYGGNVSVSFAVYFILAIPILPRGLGRLTAAAAAATVVELFEALDGFGFMQNVYDPVDFAANAAGIALALVVDVTTTRIRRP